MEKMLDIEYLIGIIFTETNHLERFFTDVAVLIFGILVFVEFTKEAINLASGRGFALDKKLIILLIISLIFVKGVYGSFSDSIYKAADLSKAQWFKIFNAEQVAFREEISSLSLTLFRLVGDFMTQNPLDFFFSLLSNLMLMLIVIVMIIGINLIVLGTYAGFALTLHCGPLFVVFLMMEETRNWFFIWLSNVIAYIVQILFMGGVMKLSVRLLSESAAAINKLAQSDMVSITEVYWKALFGPLFTITLMLIAIRVAKSLTGGGGGTEVLGTFGAAYGTMGRMGTQIATAGITKL